MISYEKIDITSVYFLRQKQIPVVTDKKGDSSDKHCIVYSSCSPKHGTVDTCALTLVPGYHLCYTWIFDTCISCLHTAFVKLSLLQFALPLTAFLFLKDRVCFMCLYLIQIKWLSNLLRLETSLKKTLKVKELKGDIMTFHCKANW